MPEASSSNPKQPPRLRLRVTATAEKIIRSGHPWIFSDSVREQNREGSAGELAVVFDRNDKFLAVGFYDPGSPIRVRILHVGKPVSINAEFWRVRFDEALKRREGLFDDRTTGYRVINGESDGWPGLVLDRYATTLVLKIYTAAWLGRTAEIVSLIRERLNPERVVLRFSRNVRGGDSAEIAFGPPVTGPVVFSENGVSFEAEVLRGQKTGFFLDQRENRHIVETFAEGRSVLNAFSFSGGFSLYAARGGAKSVTDLDISAHALESAKRNFKLNKANQSIAGCRHDSIQGDVFKWLRENRGAGFDLIVLDPPSLAKRESERAGAIGAYGKLVADGLRHLSRGGILLACSCSAHVTAEEFFKAVVQEAGDSRRRFRELQRTHHASDHHATFKEAEYLKAIYLQFD